MAETSLTNAEHSDGNVQKRGDDSNKADGVGVSNSSSYWHILIMWCKATGALLLIFSIFLACILKNRVTFQGKIEDLDGVMVIPNTLSGDPDKDGRYLYTSFEQPNILLILGILGFISVSISSFYMDILAIWISNKWLEGDKAGDKVSPMDVATLIRIIDGGWYGVLNYLLVMKEGSRLGAINRAIWGESPWRVINSVSMCSWAVHYPGFVLGVIMAMGSGISMAGMSMHMKSKAVRLVTRRRVPKEKYSLLGRRVATHCTEDQVLPCSVAGQLGHSNNVYLRDAFETFRTLKNELSRVHDIQEHDAGLEGRHTYIKKAEIPSGADYQAVTYSITTTCTVIKKECLLYHGKGQNPYESCIRPPIFDEMTGNKRFQLLMSADSAGYRKAHPSNITNPYYLAVRASRGILRGGPEPPNSIQSDHDAGEDVISLWCEVTVHDVIYGSTNGTIVNWSSKPVNATLARIFAAPSFSDLSTALLGEEMRATYARTPDTIDLCKSLSRFYSWTAVAFVAGTMEEVLSASEWRRVESYGTRLPHTVLTTLYAFVGVLVGISLLLVALAVVSAREAKVEGRRWGEVKMLVSVEGAVAQALDQKGGRSEVELQRVADLFEERTNLEGYKGRDEEMGGTHGGKKVGEGKGEKENGKGKGRRKDKWVEVQVVEHFEKMIPRFVVVSAEGKGDENGQLQVGVERASSTAI